MSYPTEWKSYLAGGGVTSVNPLLVGQDGTDYTSDSVITYSNKVKEVHESPYSSDSGDTWTGGTPVPVYVTNQRNNGLVFPTSTHIGVEQYTSYNTPYTQIDPTTITKVNKIHEVVYSGDSHSVDSNNLVLNDVSGIIQTGNNEIVKSLPITAIDNATDVFDYIDDSTNTTPTFIKFDATLTDGGKAECIWGSSDGVIDKTNVWARRY